MCKMWFNIKINTVRNKNSVDLYSIDKSYFIIVSLHKLLIILNDYLLIESNFYFYFLII